MLGRVIARAFGIFSALVVFTSAGLAQEAQPSPRPAAGNSAWIKIATITAKAGDTSATAQIADRSARYSAIRVEAENNAAMIKRVTVNPGGIAQTSSAPRLVVSLPSRGQSVESVTVSYVSQREPTSIITIVIYGLKASETVAAAPRTVQAARPARPTYNAPAPSGGVIRSAPAPRRDTGGTDTATGPAASAPRDSDITSSRPAPQTRNDDNTASSPTTPAIERRDDNERAAAAQAAVEKSAPVTVRPVSANGASIATNVCLDKKICTPVGVFFGTDRGLAPTATRIAFDGNRSEKLTLGHAFVTVPKARTAGNIQLPTFWDIHVRGVPESGDPARHFTIPAGGVSIYDSDESFIAEVKQHMANAGTFKDHAFVFIHGFYVSFDQALYRTAQIAYDLSPDGQPFGTAFLYSWPSAGNVSSYLTDEESARLAIPNLEKFLRLVIDQTGAKHIHLIAHSMGNVPLINALKTVATPENKGHINQIVLAAPDFDKVEFEKVIAAIAPVADGITLYASSTDYAMKAARKARSNLPRAGDATMPPGPPIAKSFETIDVSALDSSIFSWGHDHYAESQVLLNDMSTLFRNGQHPPPLRSLNFKPQLTTAGTFWRYVK